MKKSVLFILLNAILLSSCTQKDLPKPEKSIKQIEKEQLKRLKNKNTKLMLDE